MLQVIFSEIGYFLDRGVVGLVASYVSFIFSILFPFFLILVCFAIRGVSL